MIKTKVVPIGDYAPDISDYASGAAGVIVNAIPATDGWAPIKKFVSYGSGLGSPCKGAITVRLSDGSYAFYAGTATALYKYNAGTSSFDDVTRTVGGAYAVPEGFKWSFHQFGNKLYATNGIDANQVVDIDAGGNFAASNGPIARYVDSVNEFLVLANLNGEPRSIAWSGIGDGEYWAYGQRGSGKQEMPDGGEITGFIGQETGGVVLQKDKMRAMTFQPTSPYVFNFSVIHKKIGAIGEPSIASFRNTFYFLSDGGFYEGVQATPISDQILNKYLFSVADLSLLRETQGTIDPINKIAWWVITKTDATVMLLGYHWLLKKWTTADMEATYVVEAATPGYALENLDSFGTLETLPYSLDSRAWAGGTVGLAGFDDSGDFGFFEGNNLSFTLQTNDQFFNPGGSAFVLGARLLIDTDEANYSGRVGGRGHYGESLEWNSLDSPSSTNGMVISRRLARSHRAEFVINEGANWNKIIGIEFSYDAGGNR